MLCTEYFSCLCLELCYTRVERLPTLANELQQLCLVLEAPRIDALLQLAELLDDTLGLSLQLLLYGCLDLGSVAPEPRAGEAVEGVLVRSLLCCGGEALVSSPS